MILYRLSKSKYADDLTGIGARIAGGRWNSPGLPVIYTSSSPALCTAEVAVHLPLGILPADYCLTMIAVPDKIVVEVLDIKKLPSGWNGFPQSAVTQAIGDKFLRDCKYLILKTPSAVVQGDFNYLINPMHPDIKKVKIKSIETYHWDERLFRR